MSSITKKEAADIVLSKPAWVKCSPCGGFVMQDMISVCTRCQNLEFYRDPEVFRAYRVLGVPAPDRPQSRLYRLTNMYRTRLLIQLKRTYGYKP